MMKNNSHMYKYDERNSSIKIYINGKIVNRNDAKISVFDSGFLLGDGIWESFRLHNGVLCFINEHMERLYSGANKINIDIPYSKKDLISLVYKTTQENQMYSDVHIRIIVSRGIKITPYQHPSANIGPISIVIIPEYKVAEENLIQTGLKLKTVEIKRGNSRIQDPNINSLSKFNCIAACIEADIKGYDEALMLDLKGFVSTCNSTNFFIVKNKEVWTSTGQYCLRGVTRSNIIKICNEKNISIYEKNFLLQDVYESDEVFVTGTFAGVIPVISIDDNVINNKEIGLITKKLAQLYNKKINKLYPPNV